MSEDTPLTVAEAIRQKKIIVIREPFHIGEEK